MRGITARATIAGVAFAGLVVAGVFAAAPGDEAAATTAATMSAQAPARSSATTKTVWYFYTVKWGQQERFVALFKKNHFPVLQAQLGTRLTSIRTFVPTYHGDGRADWTFVVELTFKDAVTQVTPWTDEAAVIKKLYPDQATFQREERERFDLLTAHWDVPLNDVAMEP
jgi:hypothetical protein